MTQNERVLKLLRARAGEGVNTTDLMAPDADGGKPILRLAARIDDLRRRGHGFEVRRRSNGTTTYVLLHDAERGSCSPQASPTISLRSDSSAAAPLSAGLFDDGVGRKPRGAYDSEEAA